MGEREYKTKDITIEWEPARCIHSAECVRHLGSVFDPAARPWVHVEAEPAADIAKTIERCPTGALHYRSDDPSLAEQPDAQNTVVTRPHGPMFVRGRLELGDRADTRMALCRCGASSRKPYCDNSHRATGFADSGHAQPTDSDGIQEQAGEGTLRITAIPDGPLQFEGRWWLPMRPAPACLKARKPGSAAVERRRTSRSAMGLTSESGSPIRLRMNRRYCL